MPVGCPYHLLLVSSSLALFRNEWAFIQARECRPFEGVKMKLSCKRLRVYFLTSAPDVVARALWLVLWSGRRIAGLVSGVIAQLVERLNGIEEVRGSNPLGSTLIFQERLFDRSILGTDAENGRWIIIF